MFQQIHSDIPMVVITSIDESNITEFRKREFAGVLCGVYSLIAHDIFQICRFKCVKKNLINLANITYNAIKILYRLKRICGKVQVK